MNALGWAIVAALTTIAQNCPASTAFQARFAEGADAVVVRQSEAKAGLISMLSFRTEPPIDTYTPWAGRDTHSSTTAPSVLGVRELRAARAEPSDLTIRASRAGEVPGAIFRDCDRCPEMIVVAEGAYLKGSHDREFARDADEGPLTSVTVSAFAVARRETTVDEWNACVRAKSCRDVATDERSRAVGALPVTRVSWNDAQQYVKWISHLTSSPYRLLTEDEWEFVTRAGSSSTFSFGAMLNPENAQFAWNRTYAGSARRREAPDGPASAASFGPNEWGVFDLHGNVWEWTGDCYFERYGNVTPGRGGVSNPCGARVIRGGSWREGPHAARSANREWEAPNRHTNIIGFRVARGLEANAPSSIAGAPRR